MDKSQAGFREQSASQLSVIIPCPFRKLGHFLLHPAEHAQVRLPFYRASGLFTPNP